MYHLLVCAMLKEIERGMIQIVYIPTLLFATVYKTGGENPFGDKF